MLKNAPFSVDKPPLTAVICLPRFSSQSCREGSFWRCNTLLHHHSLHQIYLSFALSWFGWKRPKFVILLWPIAHHCENVRHRIGRPPLLSILSNSSAHISSLLNRMPNSKVWCWTGYSRALSASNTTTMPQRSMKSAKPIALSALPGGRNWTLCHQHFGKH